MFKKIIYLLIIITILFLILIIYLYNNRKKYMLDGDNMIHESIKEIEIEVNEKKFTLELEENDATRTLISKLKNNEITIDMEEYGGFEKVGNLEFSLPTNDEKITTIPGDIVLYQGNKIVLFYGSNTWSYTRLGHLKNINTTELKETINNENIKLIARLIK